MGKWVSRRTPAIMACLAAENIILLYWLRKYKRKQKQARPPQGAARMDGRMYQEAIRNGEFRMYLQPVVSAKTGRIVSVESLSRWAHPEKGMLYPGSYIGRMEKKSAVAELDFFIFEEACRLLERWKKKGRRASLSCNFTRITIDHRKFLRRLTDIAGKYDFDYGSLILEITEDVMENDKEAAFANISRCREMGFRIALDDAGSGCTSFSDLKDYAIDIVKIDRTILYGAEQEKGFGLLKGMIELAHSMGMEIQCEGVETEEQAKLLRRLGCDYMQGYYFYRPMPIAAAERILQGEKRRTEEKG